MLSTKKELKYNHFHGIVIFRNMWREEAIEGYIEIVRVVQMYLQITWSLVSISLVTRFGGPKRDFLQLKSPSFCSKTYLKPFKWSFYLVAVGIFTCRRTFSGLNLQYGTYLIPRGRIFGRGLIFGRNFVLVSGELIFGGAYIRDFTVCSDTNKYSA